MLGAGENPIALRWHLADLGWKPAGDATFEAPLGSGLLRLRVLAPRGFESELLRGRESPRKGEAW